MKVLIIVIIITMAISVLAFSFILPVRIIDVKYAQGKIVETDFIRIDDVKSEYWRKIVIETTSGNHVVLNVNSDQWQTLSVCSYVSIRFKRDGSIKDYAYKLEN